MRLEQLRLFNDKTDFNSRDFETRENKEVFSKIASSIGVAFDAINKIDITSFDSTTRANMLNNLVVDYVEKNCKNERFSFYKSLSSTRRSFGILNNEYIFLFKKHPVSNLKTNQDELIKNQKLDKHVLFVVYNVDEFWNSISKIELQYFSSPKNMTYSYDITNLLTTTTTRSLNKELEEVKPNVTIRKAIIKTRKAE